MATLFRPPIITRVWALSAAVAVGAQSAVASVPLNLIGQDKFYGAAGQVPDYDWPNPRGYQHPVSNRTHLDPLKLNLLSQDRFFGLAGSPQFDWPVPKGYVYPSHLRTHVDPLKLNLLNKDQFFTTAGRGPTYDWPNPRGYAYPSHLRTFTDPLKVNLAGKDLFFAAAGQAPRFDWPNPLRGRQPVVPYETPSLDLLQTTLAVVGSPFFQSQWPNPLAYIFSAPSRGFIAPLRLNLIGQDRFFGLAGNPIFDWPVPIGHRPELARPGALRGYTQSYDLSLIGQDTVYGAPGQVPSYDWPNPKGAVYSADLRVFYPTVFLWQRGLQTIIDTDILQRPVNVVMAGDVPIKGSGIEYDIRPANFRARVAMSGSAPQRLKGDKPSFTVRTDKKGYD